MGRKPKEEIVRPEPEPKPEVVPILRVRRRAQAERVKAPTVLLEAVLTKERMLRLADARSWKLGEEYLEAGAVAGLQINEARATAIVRGTKPYTVRLSVTSRGNLGYECSCPYHEDENVFCKHLVALGLTYLRNQFVEEIDVPVGSPMERIQTHLGGLSKEQLVTFLMAQALENEPLRRRLLALTNPSGDVSIQKIYFRKISE